MYILNIFLINLIFLNFFKQKTCFLFKANFIILILIYILIYTTYLDFSKFIFIFNNFLINFCFYGKLINYFNNSWLNFIGIVTTYTVIYLYYHTRYSYLYLILNVNKLFPYKLYICLIFLSTFLENNLFLKFNFKEIPLTIQLINTSLSNTLVVVHPLFTHILYGFLFLILVGVYNFGFIFSNKKKVSVLLIYTNALYNFFKKIVPYGFLTSGWILFLGGWWAAQELVWNNWWSWDFVEMMSLMFSILILEIIHYFNKKNTLKQSCSMYLTLPLYIIFFFFFIRYDLSMSLHSFNLFELSEFFFFQILLLFIFILFFFIFRKKNNTIIINKFEKNLHSINTDFNIFIWVLFKFLLLSVLFFCIDVLINISTAFNLKNEIIYLYSNNYKCMFITLMLVVFLNFKKKNFLYIFFFIKLIFFRFVELVCYLYSIQFLSNKNYATKEKNPFFNIITIHWLIITVIISFDLFSLFYTYFFEWVFFLENEFFFFKKELFSFSKNFCINNINFVLPTNVIVNGYYSNNSFLFNLKIMDADYLFNTWVELFYNFFVKSSFTQSTLYNVIFNEKIVTVFSLNYISFFINSIFFLLYYNIYLNKKSYNLKV